MLLERFLQQVQWSSQRVLGGYRSFLIATRRLIRCSWLIDVDRDDEGMRVIADLHGGDPENPIAKAEFREIQERVISEVMFFLNGATAHARFLAA